MTKKEMLKAIDDICWKLGLDEELEKELTSEKASKAYDILDIAYRKIEKLVNKKED